MPGFFFNLGRFVGPKVRKGKWVWNSFTADDNQIVEAEYQTGRDMANTMAGQLGLDDDAPRVEHVRELGERLASRLTDRRRRWAFYLVRSDSANAWALPGGFIFITRKLLDLCEYDPEIAFILGHEMGHVVHKHAFDRLVSSTLLTAASAATPLGRLVTPKVVQVGARLMQSAYTQDQELDADEFGVRLTASASLDPAASIRSMQRLQATHAGCLPDLFAWFATHPPFPVRIARIQGILTARKG